MTLFNHMATRRPDIRDQTVIAGKDITIENRIVFFTEQLNGLPIKSNQVRKVARFNQTGIAACRLSPAFHGSLEKIATR